MHKLVFLLTTLSVLVMGCTTTKQTKPNQSQTQPVTITYNDMGGSRNPEPITPDLYPEGAQSSPEPVIRYGRYNLATAKPTAEQQDLMAQIITTNIPANVTNPNVKDAMSYVMTRSGYDLCPIATSKEVRILYTRPLPAAHYKLGPITLRNALQVLAGPAYQVQVDEVNRSVCFSVREDYRLTTTSVQKQKTKIEKASENKPNQIKAGVALK